MSKLCYNVKMSALKHEKLLTNHDIFTENGDPVVSVWPGMFVPKSHGVPEFMDNNTKLVTIFADRNGLGTIAAFANKRTTTGKKRKKFQ